MTIQALIIWLVIGAVAGWLAGQIMRGYGFGLIGNIVVGIVGAFIAGYCRESDLCSSAALPLKSSMPSSGRSFFWR